MISQEEKRDKMITYLRALGNKEIDAPNLALGLCCTLEIMFDVRMRDFDCILNTWPESSGVHFNGNFYPVSHPTEAAHHAYDNTYNLWADDEYGDTRRRLCLWYADYLEKNT